MYRLVFANPELLYPKLLQKSAYILLQSTSVVLLAAELYSQFCSCLAGSLCSLACNWKSFLLRKGGQWCSCLNFLPASSIIFFQILEHTSESVWQCSEWLKSPTSADQVVVEKCVQRPVQWDCRTGLGLTLWHQVLREMLVLAILGGDVLVWLV